jgi:CO/xanthine dehydrogenase FAD-binding subunit
MDFLQPTSWHEALAVKSERPGALPVAGGTDVMVEINMDRRRPEALLDLTRIPGLDEWSLEDGRVRIGAGVTYARVIEELGDRLPGLAQAARTVGSPQIRNRGTVAGNLGTASPAGDALPPLQAAGADVVLASVRGERTLPLAEFCLGPKRSALRPDELIAAVRTPVAAGPQVFAKVGARAAMVIAVVSFALDLDVTHRRVGAAIGSAGPTPLRAAAAERFLEGLLDEGDRVSDSAVRRFGELVAQAARPIDDSRASAEYRRHALAVVARRALSRAWREAR